ncbi:MAG: thiamine-phosphate pyrophosphorylase [Acidobacteriota bacterium]|jgi:thiamine-phosphate pyrophosphorylase|nr:thiamine-phosphate pyrophosphorylase [Acidobacteriota bacterium]
MSLPRLYPITDRLLSGLSHAEQVARLSEGGARLVQLREKHLSPREFYSEAEEALKVARARGVRLVINDRADIALALGADGVHLGQDDMPPLAARALLGDKAIIGFSTHSVEQAVGASRLPIDYVAIGPVFATSSKDNPDAVVGLEGVRGVREVLGPIPLVAIGGVTRERARAVLEAGADSVAVLSALLPSLDPAEITRRTRFFLAELLDE